MARAVPRMMPALLVVLGAGFGLVLAMTPAGAQGRPPTQTPLPTFTTIPPATSRVPTTFSTGPATTRRPTAVTRPRTFGTTTTVPATTTSVPPTTVASIPALAPPPSTLPLAFTQTSGHVSVVFPILGGIGIVSLIGLMAVQWFLTKPGRDGPIL